VAGGYVREQVVEVLMEGQWWSLPLPLIFNMANHSWRNPAYVRAYCDLQALLARLTPNSSVRSNLDGLSLTGLHAVRYVPFQGQFLCSIDKELCDDSLVTIGRAVGRNMLIGGELINMCLTSSGCCFYTASVKGTIIDILL
jgi:hypothetical protein